MPYKCPEKRRQKAKEYSSKHYKYNRAQCIARIAEYKKAAKAQFLAFKARLACIHCGENHPATLDFHHVVRDPSNKKIYELTKNGAYAAAIKEITEKCVVLCSNCHRKVHYDERNPELPEHDQLTVDTD